MKKLFSATILLAASLAASAQTISVKDVSISKGGADPVTVSVDIEDATKANGAGMIITLPEGFTFVDDEGVCYGGEGVFYWNSKKKAGHAISENLFTPSKIKLAIVDTSSNAYFVADSGSLFQFDMQAGAEVADGEYEGVISAVEFSTQNKDQKWEDVKFKINVGATSIQTISAAETGSTVYSVAGTVQNQVKRGVNIIKHNNGKVKKVYVK